MHIVLLPGLDGTGHLLHDIQTALLARHTATVVGLPADLADYDALANWVIDRLPPHPYVLLAESFSGPLAVKIAARNPPGLAGLILAASFVQPPRRLPAALAATLRRLPLGAPWLIWLGQPFLMGRWGTRSLRHRLRQALASVPRATLAARLRNVLTTNVGAVAGALSVPKARITARHDRLVPDRASRPLQAPLSLSTDGPHLLLQCRPEEAAALVESVLAQWAREGKIPSGTP